VTAIAGLERFTCYARARDACAIVIAIMRETWPYDFLLRKGIL
jgi:L-fucose mutarotase/ribose pyranase (RbsD/FucU family)